jgi:hypothetical protein
LLAECGLRNGESGANPQPRDDEARPPASIAGPRHRSPRPPRPPLRLVHRGLRHARPKGCEGVARRPAVDDHRRNRGRRRAARRDRGAGRCCRIGRRPLRRDRLHCGGVLLQLTYHRLSCSG